MEITTQVRTGGGGDPHPPDEGIYYRQRLRRTRMGVLVALCSVVMLFVALTSAFFARQRGVGLYQQPDGTTVYWPHLVLPPILWLNTFVLLLSSVSLEMARRNLASRALLAPIADIPGVQPERRSSLAWLGVTVMLAAAFLTGQWLAWSALKAKHLTLSSNPSSQFFYLLTGAHAIHLAGGLLALLAACLAHAVAKLETRCILVDATAWYWHFMAVLWLYIFFLLHMAR